jgi:hypothetical protein
MPRLRLAGQQDAKATAGRPAGCRGFLLRSTSYGGQVGWQQASSRIAKTVWRSLNCVDVPG